MNENQSEEVSMAKYINEHCLWSLKYITLNRNKLYNQVLGISINSLQW